MTNTLEEDVKKLVRKETDPKTNVSVIFYKTFQDSSSTGRILLVQMMGRNSKPSLLAGISNPNKHHLFCIDGFKWNKNNKNTGSLSEKDRFNLIYHSSWGEGIEAYDYEVGKLIKNKSRWNRDYYNYENPPKSYKLKYLIL
jgi:hypothetical protein